MKISDITNFLEAIAPLELQESYDNAGLIVGDPETELSSCLVALDATPDIVQEAARNGHKLIVAHHPIVFKGLKKINGKNYVERAVIQAIKEDIAIYACHTNLDNVLQNGVNQKIAQRLDLHGLRILSTKSKEDPTIGSGIFGELPQSMEEKDFMEYVKDHMKTQVIRHTALLGKPIQKVAICGGAGSFLLEEAKKVDADVFITGDFKYHQFFDADGQLIILDIGHYESEQFTIDLLADLINDKFTNFAAHCTKLNTNPVHYF
ncbi:MAG: Nif3-like dinuclear metal center hexameric protein [Saprospiraceae bacterium]|nr:Nif3-like dinuclear metal center hexameric protein [Saprospiraceae bacterium]